MAKKENTKNKIFGTVRDKLEFIQKNCPEPELFEDLKQLFIKKGFRDVAITHGPTEFGKDLVFAMHNPAFGEDQWYAAVVKNKNSHQNDFVSGGEICTQIEMAFKKPYTNPSGKEISISGVFVIINGSVTFNARQIIAPFIDPTWLEHIQVWDYQRLSGEIETNIKDIFLDRLEPIVHVYSKAQKQRLSDLSNTRNLINLDIKEIDDIFVNVETSYSKQQRQLNDYVSFDGVESKKNKIEPLDAAKEVLSSSKNFIIHGIPTSGKSLLLRRIGLKALEQKSGKPNAVFYFELSKILNQKEKASEFDIENIVSAQYHTLTKGEEFKPEEFNKVFLLFDGLDEIRDEKDKIEALKAIDGIEGQKLFGNTQIVIASRTTEIVDNEEILQDFEKSELLPFNIGQALKLVKKIIPNDDGKSKAFVEALKSSLLESGLLRTPLALTLLAILYRDDEVDLNELPANITELYNKFVDTYLDRWDTNKGVSQQYKYEQTKIVLAFIGLHMQENGLEYISADDLISFMYGLSEDYSYDIFDDIEGFVEHLKYKNGVFNYNDSTDTFYFYNHYFQEFFVSLCIEDSNEEILKSNFTSEWWENSVVFYCGQKPRRDTFLLDVTSTVIPVELKDKFTYLHQVSKCLQANHAISNKSRIKVIHTMLREFDSFYNKFIAEGKEGKTFAASVTTMHLIIQFRDFFFKLFDSQFICDKKCLELFDSITVSGDKNLSEVTRYCIAYFQSFRSNDPTALEVFVTSEGIDPMWTRVIYVDIDLLNYKKRVNSEVYKRIKRKMNKKKFQIISQMQGRSIEHL